MFILLTILLPIIFFTNIFCLAKIVFYYKGWTFTNCLILGFSLYTSYLVLISIIFLIIPDATLEIYGFLLLSFQLILILIYFFYIRVILRSNIHAINWNNLFLFFVFFIFIFIINNLYLSFNYSNELNNSSHLMFFKQESTSYLSSLTIRINSSNILKIFSYSNIESSSQMDSLSKYSFNIILCFMYGLIFTGICEKHNLNYFKKNNILIFLAIMFFELIISSITFSLTNNSYDAISWMMLYFLLIIYSFDQINHNSSLSLYIFCTLIFSSSFFISWFYFFSFSILLIYILSSKYLNLKNTFRITTYIFIYSIFNLLTGIMTINYIFTDVSIFIFILLAIFILFFSFNKTWISYINKFEIKYMSNIRFFIIFILSVYVVGIILFYIFYSVKIHEYYFNSFYLTNIFSKLNYISSSTFWTSNILFWIFSYIMIICFLVLGYKYLKEFKSLYVIISISLIVFWNPFSINCIEQLTKFIGDSNNTCEMKGVYFWFMNMEWILYYFIIKIPYHLSYKEVNKENKLEDVKIKQGWFNQKRNRKFAK